ncbi:MAG: hypothetical protein IKP86_03655, partial [Anaerolineaceae bacterium]|nr:hypothetical protein [Anaerolineaceae bacterium]
MADALLIIRLFQSFQNFHGDLPCLFAGHIQVILSAVKHFFFFRAGFDETQTDVVFKSGVLMVNKGFNGDGIIQNFNCHISSRFIRSAYFRRNTRWSFTGRISAAFLSIEYSKKWEFLYKNRKVDSDFT